MACVLLSSYRGMARRAQISPPRVAVVGAGLAGLALARALRGRAAVAVFERSPAPGGRLVTHRTGDFSFDYGAQFFTARTPAFRRLVAQMVRAGVVRRWDAGFAELHGPEVRRARPWHRAPAHYVGAPGMDAIGPHLAQDLDVRCGVRVAPLDGAGPPWHLRDADGADLGAFDWVITTTPPAQARALLPPDFAGADALDARRMAACFSLMLGLPAPPALPFDAALVKGADISWISVNSTKPGRPAGPCLLVHATNRWADAHTDDDPRAVTAHLCAEVARVTGLDAAGAAHVGLHAWRYANIGKARGPAALLDAARGLAACGDWCVQGRVEAAFTSAMAAARAVGAAMG
jgi:renalase